ncbi:MAG TPA: LysM peptidoglycan-binding domain-containing protein, partial [Leucothrix sp.]|nr:LysM peptidoglycan-binding domain-containing protein [Leucothrix sp.]
MTLFVGLRKLSANLQWGFCDTLLSSCVFWRNSFKASSVKKKALVLAVYMACAVPNSGKAKALSNNFSGLNLGEVKSHSSQGEVFNGVIPILLTSQKQAKRLKVRLASKAVFAQLGAERKPELDHLIFKIRTHKNKPVIVVSSNRPIHLPIISFILEIESPNGMIYQVYTVMLSSPKVRAATTPKKVKQKKKPQPYFSSRALRKTTTKYKVRSGDTLSIIAGRYKHKGISSNRMMKSIHSTNPKAFIRNNINKLKKGYVLHIPSATNINQFDIITAHANAEHRATKQTKASRKRSKLNTYKIKRGDTLSKITKKFVYQGVSFTRMMKAVHKTNPHAFIKNKRNMLKVGVRLRIPTYSEVVHKKQQIQRTTETKKSTQNTSFAKNSRSKNNRTIVSRDNSNTTTVDKLQNSIDKLNRSQLSSVTPDTEKSQPPKSYSSNDLADLYKQAFGKKTSRKTSKRTTFSTSPSEENQGTDLAALYAKAFGKKRSFTAPSEVNVDLRVNKTNIGEVTIFSNKQGALDRVETKPLLKALKGILKEHIYKRLHKKFSKSKYLLIKNLAKQGIRANYNSVNLSLDLKIKPELRKPRVLSLYKKRSISVRKENKIKAEEFSGFINMYSNTSLNLGKQNKPDFKMKLEGSLGINDMVLESTVDLNNTNWRAGRTTLTYDKPDKLQRFVLGDISTGNRNFQENLELLGIRASKEFFMKPELQIRPKANESFILETDSQVEVLTNNQLRQRFYLEKGVYSLEDIGLNNGENNIQVRITDAFGKVTTKTSQ